MSSLVILGIWVAVIGYGVAYAGMQKLNGDPTYSLGKSFRGVPPTIAAPASSGAVAGVTAAQRQAQLDALQSSLIGSQPIAA